MAKEVQPTKIVSLAERVLVGRLIGHREEFRGDDFTAVLYMSESIGFWVSTRLSWHVHDR